MTTINAIEVAGLRKSYGDHEVIAGLDLTVPAGTVYALLGSNGAGKTTTVRILSTLLPADAGQARIAGYDVRREADQVRLAFDTVPPARRLIELLRQRGWTGWTKLERVPPPPLK